MAKKGNFQKPKGTNDCLPSTVREWQYLESVAREVFEEYQFREIRTPIFENYEIFARAVGETSDIVSKEMYDFYDKGERHISLRPEGTASVVRAFVENKLFAPEINKPYKVYYLGPMFRYERPQSGRMRQFHQIGVEAFDSENPAIDAETIVMLMELFKRLGLKNLRLVINSLGDAESRLAYRAALVEFFKPHFEQLSDDSRRRLYENPLRVLDSKDVKDQEIIANAPSILEYLNEESRNFFENVQKSLKTVGIFYEIDPNMVRGLDYYNHTIFEVMSDSLGGAKTTIAGGGRYDGLVEYFGGPKTPSFGFAFGIERLLMVLAAEKIQIPQEAPLDVYVVVFGDEANLASLPIVQAIRKAGFSVDRDFSNRKAKAQFKTASILGAKLIVTIGEREVAENVVNLKNSETRREIKVSCEQIYDNFVKIYDELLK